MELPSIGMGEAYAGQSKLVARETDTWSSVLDIMFEIPILHLSEDAE